MKPTYTMHVSELELVLMEDLLDYALDTFEAEDAKTAELFRLACEGLMAKTAELRVQMGKAPKAPSTGLYATTPSQVH